MAFKLANRVKMTVSGTPGTGTITLGSAVTGYVSFAVGGISDGDTVSYVIEDTGGAWEIGTGTYTASGTLLARTTVTASSAGGTTKISATSEALVFIAPLAADLQSTDTLTSGTLSVGRGGTGITSLTAGYIPFGAGASPFGSSANLFWDSANARLGIGTSSPTQKLDVNGSIAITAAGARIIGDFSNATVANRALFQSSSTNANTSVGSIPNGTGTVASFVSINNSDPANSAYLSITATSTDARLWSDIVGSGAYLPITFFAGGSERMRIDSSGNVGIGTTSPSHRLSVGAQTGGTSTATPDVISIGSTYSNTAGANAKLRVFWDGLITYGFGVSSSQLDYIVSGAYSHVWYSNGSERMRITSAGNVGIGTSSPTSNLEIYSTGSAILAVTGDAGATLRSVRASNDADASNLILRKQRGSVASPTAVASGDRIGNVTYSGYGGTNNRTLCLIQGVVDTYTSDTNISSYLTFGTSSSGSASATERMRIDSSGNVGIGTSSPGVRLHLKATASSFVNFALENTNGGANAKIVDFLNNGNDFILRLVNDAYNAANSVYSITRSGTSVSSQIWYVGAAAEAMRITSDGSVGINTSSPGARLHVRGGNLWYTTSDFALNTTGTVLAISTGASTGNTYGLINATNSGGAAWSDLVLQSGGGKVLIGTTTAGASKLTVADDSIQINTAKTPASATAAGTTGQVCWDASYIYVCTATNTWKRAAIATW